MSFTAIRGGNLSKVVKEDTKNGGYMNGVNSRKNNDIMNDVSVYPNPTNGIVHISFHKEEPFNLYVRSESGQLIHYEEQTASSQYMVDITSFPRGVYLLTIEMKNNTITKKSQSNEEISCNDYAHVTNHAWL